MSDFFTKSDGKRVEQSTSYDAGGGDFELIPNNTALLAAISEAKWANYDNDPAYINIKWTVMLPEKYRGRILFQKIRVNHREEKKADKAKDMFVTIDTLAGGKLFKAGVEPTDASLMGALSNKAMMIQSMVWEIKTDIVDGVEVDLPKEEWTSGNWIRAVESKEVAKEAIARQQAERELEAAANVQAPAPRPRPTAAAASTSAAPTPRPRPGTRTAAAASAPAPETVKQVDGDQPPGEPDFDSFDDDIPF